MAEKPLTRVPPALPCRRPAPAMTARGGRDWSGRVFGVAPVVSGDRTGAKPDKASFEARNRAGFRVPDPVF
jgi:hypothetical protein